MLRSKGFLKVLSLSVILSLLCLFLLTLSYAAEAQDNPSLIITELVVDGRNVGGADGFEYVEIYNNSGKPVNMSGYRILYRYPDYPSTSDLVWDITSNAVIPDKAFFIVWLKNMSNPDVAALTQADFENEYSYGGVTPVFSFNINPSRLGVVNSTGMYNSGSRTIILATDAGYEICNAAYTAADVSACGSNESDPKKSIHYRYNDGITNLKQMIKMGADYANPCRYVTSDTWDQVPKYPTSYRSGVPVFSISELCPSTSNVGTADGYEFIELYNNRATAQSLDSYHIDYSGSTWQISGTGLSVPAKSAVVLWIKNDQNSATTKQQFKDFHSITMDDRYIVYLSCGGMSNSGARTVSVARDSDDAIISSAYYDPAAGDVVENMGINYKVNESNPAQVKLVKLGVLAATPGFAKIGQGWAPWYSYSEDFNIPQHDYAFAVLPDPQYYTINDTNAKAQTDMMNYFANFTKYGINNLAHLMCVGDIADKYSDVSQYVRADAAFDILDSKGLSYGVVSGNHDTNNNISPADAANFHNYFGYQRFTGRNGYGGYHLNSAGYTDGMYFLITQGSDNYIIVYAGDNAGSSSTLRTWAKGIFDAYPDRTGILVTHEYLSPSDPFDGDWDTKSPGLRTWIHSANGTTIYNDIVAPCPNVLYVICGHEAGGLFHQPVTIGSRTVQEIILDFQVAATPQQVKAMSLYYGAHGAHFGMGFMTMMFFDKSSNQIHFRSYSPWAQKNNWYDKFGDGFDSFDVPLTLVGQ